MDMAEPSRTATTLYIAIPAYERKVDVEILTAVAQLPGVYPHVTFALDFIVSSIITNARNYLVRQFLTSDCEWLYFWDADVVIRDMTFLTKLLETAESLGAKIVGGAYRIKSYETLCRRHDGRWGGPELPQGRFEHTATCRCDWHGQYADPSFGL